MIRRHYFSSVLFFFATLLLLFKPADSALAAPARMLPGHVPQAVASLRSTGPLPGDTRLTLAIGLPLRNPDALNTLLQAIYDPTSPQFRHYLTPDQFTETFGPTTGDYQAVVDFAKANRFTITALHSDRMLVDVTAAASDIERAFNISLRLYPHPTEARSFYAPDAEPSVPSSLSIADISGLNNYVIPHPKNLRRKPLHSLAKNTSADGSGPDGNFIGGDYRAAYAPGVTLTGAGQTVGLFEYDNFYAADVASYKTKTGLTNTVQTILLNGYNGAQGSGDGEVALDIEMIMSMAPACKIISYETTLGNPAVDILTVMATNTAIKQFSCSWDFTATPSGTEDSYFKKMATQGQSFFDASGDSGAYTGTITTPNDDAFITLVGGTALFTSKPGGPWLDETVWNAPDIFDYSSGGISTTYALPTWQAGVATVANQGSTTHRNVPDVAMVADNIYIVADNGQDETSGGTSAAAPLWAAFIALANQQAAEDGVSSVGFINPTIYSLYKSASYSAILNDITSGNNTNGSPGFFAEPGYDLCTGLGSPTGASLIDALVSPDGFVIAPGRGFTAAGPIGGSFSVSSQSVLLTNSSDALLNWSLGPVPAWLTVSSQSGAIATDSTANVTVALNSVANTMAPGLYTAGLWFTNLSNGRAQLRQFTLQIGQNLVHDGGFESGDFSYWTLGGFNAVTNNFADDGQYTDFTAHSGNWYAVLGQTDGYCTLSQVLPTVAGQPYLISYWAENPSGDTPNQIITEFATATVTNTILNQIDISATTWQNQQIVAVAPTNSAVLQFATKALNYYLALDDVSVAPVPLPTVQALQQSATSLQLTFLTVSGLIYQVQYTPTLSPAAWTDVGNPISATGSSTTVSETIEGAGQGYYRITLTATM